MHYRCHFFAPLHSTGYIAVVMLRVVASVSAGQAKQYYAQGLSREDYYSEGQEVIGQWQGLGAERLGLSGRVDQRSFDALADNLRPGSDESLTPRTKENRRVGHDFNFHCPKSVSVVYEQNRDERIFGAFKMSVTETMRELETDMKTRVRVRGENSDRNTGNLVWAEFHHFTARPVKGIPDPHLHAHCFAERGQNQRRPFRCNSMAFPICAYLRNQRLNSPASPATVFAGWPLCRSSPSRSHR